MKMLIFLIAAIVIAVGVAAKNYEDTAKYNNPYKLKIKHAIIPASLVGISCLSFQNNFIIYQNHEIRDELQECIDKKFKVDNFSQYAPAATCLALDIFNVPSMNGTWDKTIIMGTSYLLMFGIVQTVKYTTHVRRPDESSSNSYPSGHTATAFVGAEILRTEYWDVSPWIGISGYAVGLGTGFLRMYNNRHWLTDVIAGIGIGIFCARVGYILYPIISKYIFSKRYKKNIYLSPYIDNKCKGLSLQIRF